MSERLANICVDEYQDAVRECRKRKESMAWAVDKLRRLKRNLEYCTASCEEIAQALSEDNPKLKGV